MGYEGKGYYTLSGTGVLSVATEWVGYAGSGGTFTQSGGTNTVSSVLMVDNVLARDVHPEFGSAFRAGRRNRNLR